MSFHTTADSPSATLYVRGDMFGANDQQNEVIRRLRELEHGGRIDDYEVCVWNGRVALTDETQPVVEQYHQFEAWADDAGVSIEPFFTVRERESFIDGTARELILPVMCLALHTEDGLEAVAPNSRSDETTSVHDCLDELKMLDAPAQPVAVAAED